MRQPTFYIPHGGGPCFFMDWDPPHTWHSMRAFLEGLLASVAERPRAILLVSAHWEAATFTAGSVAKPALIYDYYGFPPHTYHLTYPAVGDPALARRVEALLQAAGIAAGDDPARGLDHGAFIPLKLIAPAADIPVVQLSLRADYDPAAHVAAGAALAPLRDEGVLIIGSGMSFHNLPGWRDPVFMQNAARYAAAFDDWLAAAVTNPDPAARAVELADWESAPFARQEHLLPLMVAAGAAGSDVGSLPFRDAVFGTRLSGVRFG